MAATPIATSRAHSAGTTLTAFALLTPRNPDDEARGDYERYIRCENDPPGSDVPNAGGFTTFAQGTIAGVVKDATGAVPAWRHR